MARYFYDYSVRTTIVRDVDGIVCRDDKAAIRNGQIALSELLAKLQHILPWQHFEVIVRREDGPHVGRLGLTLTVETLNPANAASLASIQESQRDGHIRDDQS